MQILFVVKLCLIDMKNLIYIIVAAAIVWFAVACNKSPVEGDVVQQQANDGLQWESLYGVLRVEYDSLNGKFDILKNKYDSLVIAYDSINEALFVANYKLGRIAYYNSIAAKSSNLKYLRGWVNRVLND